MANETPDSEPRQGNGEKPLPANDPNSHNVQPLPAAGEKAATEIPAISPPNDEPRKREEASRSDNQGIERRLDVLEESVAGLLAALTKLDTQSNEPRQGDGEAPRPETTGNRDTERRVDALEKSSVETNKALWDMSKTMWDGHKWWTTAMFWFVGLILTGLGIWSKIDVGQATRDMKTEVRDSTGNMQTKVDGAIGEMEKRFQALSGEALRKPLLRISLAQGLLDGRQFEIAPSQPLPIYPLFITNAGDKRTEPLSFRLYASARISYNTGGGLWVPEPSNDKDYPFGYYMNYRGAGISVAAKETWTLEDEYGGGVFPITTNVINLKLQIFYGGELPAEAKFVVKFK